jgi:hypothetical protein
LYYTICLSKLISVVNLEYVDVEMRDEMMYPFKLISVMMLEYVDVE